MVQKTMRERGIFSVGNTFSSTFSVITAEIPIASIETITSESASSPMGPMEGAVWSGALGDITKARAESRSSIPADGVNRLA